jgi:glycine cleavage system H protein
MMNIPGNLYYTDHDEWVRSEGDCVVIGITDYAQDALGELVHVELPEVGTSVAVGEALCEVESVKAVAEVYSPVAGEVVEVNEDISEAAETINEDPYEAGWLCKVRVSGTLVLGALLDAEEYTKKVANS